MGNSLAHPVTEKQSESGRQGSLSWGASSMQGWRVSMEDSHLALAFPDLPDHCLFAVFDGHGGSLAAEYARENTVRILKQQSPFQRYVRMAAPDSNQDCSKKKKKKKNKGQPSSIPHEHRRPDVDTEACAGLLLRALEDALVELDRQLLQEMIRQEIFVVPAPTKVVESSCKETASLYNLDDKEIDLSTDPGDWTLGLQGTKSEDEEEEIHLPGRPETTTPNMGIESVSGTTATIALVTPDIIVCANLGDARTVLDGFPLSTDHKPGLEHEEERIRAANGHVVMGRVEGELAVSRALGDYEYKETYDFESFQTEGVASTMEMEEKRAIAQRLKVSPFPEVRVQYRCDTDRILILACDGIWDVMSNEECCHWIAMLFEEGESKVELIAEEVLDLCLKRGSRDNMTIIVVKLPAQEVGRGGGVMKRRARQKTTHIRV